MPSKIDRITDVIDNLRRVFQVVHGHSQKAIRETGLTGPQLWAVKVIADAAPIKVSDIASRMYLHPATIGGIIDRLEVRNLVVRTRSSQDRRVVYVDLTKLGRELVNKAPEVAQDLLVKGLEVLSEEQFSCIAEGMEQVVRILGAENITPQPLHSKAKVRQEAAIKEETHEKFS